MSIPDLANHNAAIDPGRDAVRRLRDAGRDGPVVMANFLKFHTIAAYPPGHPDAGSTGIAAYARYQHAFMIAVGATSRAELLYDGPVEQCFIGVPGSEAADWDKLLLVRYPSRQHFLAMMAEPGYRDALVHRYAGLARTVLLQCG
jgi:hypothetical protein